MFIILSMHYTPNELFRQVVNDSMGWIAGETPGPCSYSKNAWIFFKIDESSPNYFIFKEFHI